MAEQSVERLVMAYDGKGGLVPTPESQVVRVGRVRDAINMDGMPFTPRLARALFCEGIDQLPHRLVSIESRGHRLRVEIEFKNPCTRSMAGSKLSSLAVLTEDDARDPYFDNLSRNERARIISAFQPIANAGKVRS